VLFVKVDRPGQILHAVLPFWYLIVGENSGNLAFRNILFCRKDSGFAHSLKQFQKVREAQDKNLLFMLHPENLYEEELNLLRDFHNKSLPLVIVIASL
jgi:hypothetical protein